MKLWTGFIWLRIDTDRELLSECSEPSGSLKYWDSFE
jgi:hypothetical protein